MNNTIDPQKFKSIQRQNWDSVAAGWSKWWKVIEEHGQVVSDKLVELTGIQQGSRVLDVAAGIGEPAVTAARKVGPAGKITAVDLSPRMIAVGKERAKEAGLSNIIEFQEGDAESVHLPSSSFDAITCRFGLMFMPDIVGTLKNMREALAPDGRIAAAVWSSVEKVPAFRLALEIVMRETGASPPAPGSPGPFSLADTDVLRKKFEQAGFNDIRIETGPMNFYFDSPEKYVDFARSTAGPLGQMMSHLPAARQEEIWSNVVNGARSHADPKNGSISFSNEVIYVTARR